MPDTPTYEIYALRYAVLRERQRHENFITPDAHDGLMPLDYFVWAIVNSERTVVVDTGFGALEAGRRGRELLCTPRAALATIGIDAATVEDVIITHLHYDHAGETGAFPGARFHLQDLEMQFATGRYMRHAAMRHAFAVDDVVEMVRRVYDGRVIFHNGDAELFPGISVHHVGGHTMGLQCVRVHTQRGWVVLASDASHFYENMLLAQPFPVVFNVADMLDGYAVLRRWADSDAHIVPGHDPLVLTRYPPARGDLSGIVVRLDLLPIF
jgi:glyoxylase-like metal-dependent hydrolase (beta-lactamase superfamily II)